MSIFNLSIMSKSRNLSTVSSKVLTSSFRRNEDYDTCIEVLNSLQSNAQYIKAKADTTNAANHTSDQLVQVEKFLTRSGLSLDKLDDLSIIHVTGTKGKGTTCAFSESILRNHGYKTGFFSSPHLLEVRERIRINGKPIGRDEFSSYFWKIYNSLDKRKSDEVDMPLYFRFLTIMAFNIFIDHKVDVAIIEVGIGGEYDCTNVIRKTPVVGITSIGIDHTSLLGNTLQSIAWNKAGIMKKNCKAFTVPQSPEAMEILKNRSVEKCCELEVINPSHFGIHANTTYPSDIFNLNAGLAVALCETWITTRMNNNANCMLSEELTRKALQICIWPGRFQVIQKLDTNFYLDGAHTLESIRKCAEWFQSMTAKSNLKKGLIFNVTGGRDATNMLQTLRPCEFNFVMFVTNNATPNTDRSDNVDFSSTNAVIQKCEQNKQAWLYMEKELLTTKPAEVVAVFPTVQESLEFIDKTEPTMNVLVTGSLHLIGATLSIIQADLNCDKA